MNWRYPLFCFALLSQYLNGIGPIEALERVRNGLLFLGTAKRGVSWRPSGLLVLLFTSTRKAPLSSLLVRLFTFNFACSIAQLFPSLNVEAKMLSNDIYFSQMGQ